eukprot:NODE_5642_length_923_cov_128.871250_g5419_i0.p1 GENE.NODE_5642_length_923_cov_128.871250_g5419_i0~~NODE_5642_length_923_cov_128.871250_g5419_i0.p1  ORF type:complete len:212 (+),score=26.23 NODE_5642_length_923_cov_128.871250_g5419_i0:84-719(+)
MSKVPLEATLDMCNYCFHTLHEYLQGGKQEAAVPPSLPDISCPLFVTWKKGPRQDLRGCIGTHSPLPLVQGLSSYAMTSAFNDTRFSPISAKELPELQCGISLLLHFERGQHCYDWQLGLHGIKISFPDPSAGSSGHRRPLLGTFLPSVAPEQGWSVEGTIEHLIRKAGYKHKITDAILQSISLERFQASCAQGTYADFVEYYNTYFAQQY